MNNQTYLDDHRRRNGRRQYMTTKNTQPSLGKNEEQQLKGNDQASLGHLYSSFSNDHYITHPSTHKQYNHHHTRRNGGGGGGGGWSTFTYNGQQSKRSSAQTFGTPGLADQTDNWRSRTISNNNNNHPTTTTNTTHDPINRSNDSFTKSVVTQNDQDKDNNSGVFVPQSNTFYSSQHTNGTTYYYTMNDQTPTQTQIKPQPPQLSSYNTIQYYNTPPVIGTNTPAPNNYEFSNTEIPVNDGANAMWRSHQQRQKKKTEQNSTSENTPDISQQPSQETKNNGNQSRKTKVTYMNNNSNNRSRKSNMSSQRPYYYHPDDKPSPTRESLFEPFLNPHDMEKGLEDGTLYEGIFKVGRARLDCYVVTDSLDHDIYIGGIRDRNRAFNGDRVVVRLKDVEEGWKLKKERKERWLQNRKKRRLEKLKQEDNDNSSEQQEEEPQEEEESDDSSYNEEDHKPKYCGEVVGIKYRSPGLSFSGIISMHRDGSNEIDPNSRPKIAWFRPLDKKIPLLVIPPKLMPLDFIDNTEYYESNYFLAEFKDWRIFEQSPNIASYKLIGTRGDFETEKKCIINDNDIDTNGFSRLAMNSLPITPWIIPLREYVTRRDLRTKRIFSIDPKTAKDLDDALHIDCLQNEIFEVGVHIADVTYFLKQNTPLDTEARERATSTYLVDAVIPMLPELLSEELCSLNPGVDRLAFSVIWKMKKNGDILDTWFGKTIIRSCAKLAYEDAQNVIEGNNMPDGIELHNNQEIANIESDIIFLLEISKSLRQKRYQSGALSLHSVKLRFDLDKTGIPDSVSTTEIKEANRLIEEFMLQANISVAQKLLNNYPDEALLRRHEEPHERRLEEFRLLTEKLGLDFDISTAGALQASFNRITNDDLRAVLQVIAIRPMKRAKYFCSGVLDITKYIHYALNEPVYTHFTSPIRRYADVIVHRALFAAISGKDDCVYAKKRLQEIANDCNRKRDNARNAQDMNTMLYLGVYLNNLEAKQGPVYSRALVISVRKRGFDIYLPEYGLEKSVGLDSLPIENSMFDKHRYILAIFWKRGIPVTMHSEEKIYAQKRERPDDNDDNGDESEEEEEEGNSGGGLARGLSELGLDSDEKIQFPVKEFFNNETCMQELKMFSPLDVRIQVNMKVSPPYINVYPINHFADVDDIESSEEEEGKEEEASS